MSETPSTPEVEHLVFTFARPSDDAAETAVELRRWYDDEHLPQVRALPGIVDGRRLEPSPSGFDTGTPSPPGTLAVYEVSGDLADALGGLGAAVRSGDMTFSPALDRGSVVTWTYRYAPVVRGRRTAADDE